VFGMYLQVISISLNERPKQHCVFRESPHTPILPLGVRSTQTICDVADDSQSFYLSGPLRKDWNHLHSQVEVSNNAFSGVSLRAYFPILARCMRYHDRTQPVEFPEIFSLFALVQPFHSTLLLICTVPTICSFPSLATCNSHPLSIRLRQACYPHTSRGFHQTKVTYTQTVTSKFAMRAYLGNCESAIRPEK